MGKERLMPAEGGRGTQSFLNCIGPIIDFVLGVTYLRDTLPTVVKTLNKGTDKLVGSTARPVDEQDAEVWMDRNVTAACKACVRVEKRREAALQKEADITCEACRSKRGIHTCSTRHGQHATLGQSTSASSTRKRQAPRKLEQEIWSSTPKSAALVARSHGSKAKETALRAERRLREQTRRLLMATVWKQYGSRPQEGRGLVGWRVESTQVDERDAETLCAGQIVSFARPDRYTVEWSDKSMTEYGYSDLFPRDDVPIVLPFGQLDKTHPMAATPSLVGRHKAHAVPKGSKRVKCTTDNEMEGTVPAIRYKSSTMPGTVAALPSRHDDHVCLGLAADTTTVSSAAADLWPTGALGPKSDGSIQNPCKFLRRGQLPATTDSHTAASDTPGVQQQTWNDSVPDISKTATPRKFWSSAEFRMLREMMMQGAKPTAISDALNSAFHDKNDVRTYKSISSAWRRFQRKQSTHTSATGQVQAQMATSAQVNVGVEEGEEYLVEKILRKRWLGTTAEYEVMWQGYEATSWEPVSSLTLCVPAIEFERLEWSKQQSVRLYPSNMDPRDHTQSQVCKCFR
eukprot:COSAG02_NODE_849_length_16548_cov_6.418384_13_plen_571_part_00